MHSKRSLLILLLAFWLPLQSFAGALLHCQLIDSAAATAPIHAGHHLEISEAAATADCHGQAEAPAPASWHAGHDADTGTELPCNHCTGTCHGIQTLSPDGAWQQAGPRLQMLAASLPAAEICSIPDSPRRPPRQA